MNNWTVPKGKLPYRQAQVLSGIANGLTDKEMAEEAGVKPSVIHGTVNTLFYKLRLGRGRRAALVAEAIREGFLQSGLTMMLLILVQVAAGNTYDWRPRTGQNRTTQTVRVSRSRSRELDIDIAFA